MDIFSILAYLYRYIFMVEYLDVEKQKRRTSWLIWLYRDILIYRDIFII